MIRLIFLTDFTETFPHALLQGVLRYAKERSKTAWVVCRMPPSYKEQHGIEGVLQWAVTWKADAIIGRFEASDNVNLLRQRGIVVVAQDFKQRFDDIPNITGDYIATGAMAADFFLRRGFRHFAFLGYRNIVWSDERCQGFYRRIADEGYAQHFYSHTRQDIESFWFCDVDRLSAWLKALPARTALFCCDDNQGNNALELCKLCGIKVPADVAILGVDDDVMIGVLSDPKLSSIRLDIEQGGFDTAALIEQLIAGGAQAVPHDVCIQPLEVVNRASSDVFATEDKYILRALDFIHRNIGTPIGVEDVRKELPLSRRLLEIRFRKATGTSVYNYILKGRLELFASMLETSALPVSTLIEELGVSNYGSFSHKFRALKGCTPTEYRHKNKLKE